MALVVQHVETKGADGSHSLRQAPSLGAARDARQHPLARRQHQRLVAVGVDLQRRRAAHGRCGVGERGVGGWGGRWARHNCAVVVWMGNSKSAAAKETTETPSTSEQLSSTHQPPLARRDPRRRAEERFVWATAPLPECATATVLRCTASRLSCCSQGSQCNDHRINSKSPLRPHPPPPPPPPPHHHRRGAREDGSNGGHLAGPTAGADGSRHCAFRTPPLCLGSPPTAAPVSTPLSKHVGRRICRCRQPQLASAAAAATCTPATPGGAELRQPLAPRPAAGRFHGHDAAAGASVTGTGAGDASIAPCARNRRI